MDNNRIFIEDDKRKLAKFLFQLIRRGVDEREVREAGRIWVEKDGKVSSKDLGTMQGKDVHIFTDLFMFSGVGTGVISALPLSGVLAGGYEDIGSAIAASMFTGFAVLLLLASVGCFIGGYFCDKGLAKKFAKEAIDNHNVEYCKELKNTSGGFINKVLDKPISSSIYPNLDEMRDRETNPAYM